MAATFGAGRREAVEFEDDEMWTSAHTMHALIYEFKSEGARNVTQSLPSDVAAEDHVARAGIYRNLRRFRTQESTD